MVPEELNADEILMPALSPTMTEGKLAKWVKQEGDDVKSGDILAEIETDKATMEVEAVDEGKLGKILIAEGTEGVAVNTPIALLVGEGEDACQAGNAGSRRQTTQSAALQKVEGPRTRRKPTLPVAPPPAPKAAPPASDEDKYFEKTVKLTVREALARRHGRRDAP